jgi:tRNA(Arg) A34 adenosine deaminase TadA
MLPRNDQPAGGHMAQREFMLRAIELSRQGVMAGDGGPFGTVIVKGDRIVGEGWNRVPRDNDPTAHAEVVAIRDAGRRLGTFDLSGCDLYVNGAPCAMCLASSLWARIDRMYYVLGYEDSAAIGLDDKHVYEEIARPLGGRNFPMIQMPELSAEARAVYRAWKEKPDKTAF